MPISSFEQCRVSELLATYCSGRIPEDVRDKVRLTFDWGSNYVVLVEERPPWKGRGAWTRFPIAKFRYFVGRQEWMLYCRDRNERWHRYELAYPAPTFDVLLAEVDRDPTCIFWG